ncbi:hypothetical protein GJAV_G00266100 [Gymnothorax javanicus]|nr:hypothetical protein GJAV_G00266100 [Gymnothorax javanicus]
MNREQDNGLFSRAQYMGAQRTRKDAVANKIVRLSGQVEQREGHRSPDATRDASCGDTRGTNTWDRCCCVSHFLWCTTGLGREIPLIRPEGKLAVFESGLTF